MAMDNGEKRLVWVANLMTLSQLKPSPASRPSFGFFRLRDAAVDALCDAGFSAMQSHLFFPCTLQPFHQRKMGCYKAAIVNIDRLADQAKRWQQQGYRAATLIIGDGEETQACAITIAERVVSIAEELDFPLYIELHRGSVTANIHTALAMAAACPRLMFNADFSHYLLAYRLTTCSTAALAAFIALMTPLFSRIAFMHIRLADHSHIQQRFHPSRALTVYALLLRKTFAAFQQADTGQSELPIAVELLPPFTGYSDVERDARGHHQRHCRYQEALRWHGFCQAAFEAAGCCEDLWQALRANEPVIAGSLGFMMADEGDTAVLSLETEEQLAAAINHPTALQDFATVRVRLGTAWCSQDEKCTLITRYRAWQVEDKRVVLETFRGTLTHRVSDALALSAANIRLSINACEWVLGSEIKPDGLSRFYQSLVPLLEAGHAVQKAYATAEYQFDAPLAYRLRGFLRWQGWQDLSVISVIIELMYCRFYRRLGYGL